MSKETVNSTESSHNPVMIVLNEEQCQKLIEKIKSMPNFNEYFSEHVDESMKNNCDPFKGFAGKAVDHWNLYEYIGFLQMEQMEFFS